MSRQGFSAGLSAFHVIFKKSFVVMAIIAITKVARKKKISERSITYAAYLRRSLGNTFGSPS